MAKLVSNAAPTDAAGESDVSMTNSVRRPSALFGPTGYVTSCRLRHHHRPLLHLR